MKRFLSLALSLLLIVMMIPLGTFVASAGTTLPIDWFGPDPDPVPQPLSSGTTGDCTWALYEGGRLLISGEGAMGNYEPFLDPAPWGESITEVVIADGVTSIGSKAFYNCKTLTSATIPDSVTSIGHWAFRVCTSLTSVIIPDSVTSIGHLAFEGCTSLTSVTISDSVPEIGSMVFYGCTGLADADGFIIIHGLLYGYCGEASDVVIPDTVTTIGYMAFENCTNLTSVTIPDSVTFIDYGAFCGCEGLTSMVIPDSVTEIGDYAFNGCTCLMDDDGFIIIRGVLHGYCGGASYVVVPDSVTSVGSYAFSDCTNLTSVTISDSVTMIGEGAFAWCTSLESVSISDSVTSIGENAFYDCMNLTSVTIGKSVTSIGNYAFEYWDNEADDYRVPPNLTLSVYKGSAAHTYAVDNEIPFELIEAAASSGTTGDCTWALNDGVLTVSGKGRMADYEDATPWGTDITAFVAEEGVTYIGSGALGGCAKLASVTLPSTLTEIGQGAFGGTAALTSATLPAGVTKLGMFAFGGSGLTAIHIPAALTDVGGGAIGGCTALESITVDAENPVYRGVGNALVFKDSGILLTGCKATVIPADGSVTAIGMGAFMGCSTLTALTVPACVTEIGEQAFSGCPVTLSVYENSAAHTYAVNNGIPFEFLSDEPVATGTTGDCTWALYGDGSLILSGSGATADYEVGDDLPWGDKVTSLVAEDGVTAIGAYAFWNCMDLTAVTLADSVTAVGEAAFLSCETLGALTAPGLTDLGEAAFACCWALADEQGYIIVNGILFDYCGEDINLTLPNSVTAVGAGALGLQPGVTSVSLPVSVTGIGAGAFADNEDLTTVVILASVTGIGEHAFDDCPNLTLYVYEDSAAHAYAMANGIPFVLIEGPAGIPGDLDGDEVVTDDDAIYLLLYTFFPDEYPIDNPAACDFDGDGFVSDDDAIWLLLYTFFPDEYPIA